MLALEEWIAKSDDDLEIWASVTVGFDDDKNLVVKYEYVDYEEDTNNSETIAFVSLEDAYKMARRLNVQLTALPATIKKRCGYRSDQLVPSQVKASFKEVLNYIISCGVSYKFCR